MLVDAEDMGRPGHINYWLLGTQSFVKQYKGELPQYAICVDMIADKNPIYKIEGFSYRYEIWAVPNMKYNIYKSYKIYMLILKEIR